MTIVLETDETGALHLPAEVLGAAKPGARYVVETSGGEMILRPEPTETARPDRAGEAWIKEWRKLAQQVTREWNTDKSAADIISEMRR